MPKTDPSQRVAELHNLLHHHNHKYYVDAAPEISDREFDRLLKELTDLETAHPELVTPDSPTQRVGGAAIEGFAKVTHRVLMMSIDNSYDADDLRKFDADVRKAAGNKPAEYTVELKIDGVSMSLVYENGKLALGATRGRGDVGDDVTHNLRVMPGVPLKLNTKTPPAIFEVRGEVYMTRAELARINAEKTARGEEVYANARNTTAGTLKLLDPKESSKRKLSFFAYGLGHTEGIEITTQVQLFETLKQFGFPVNPHWTVAKGVDDLLKEVETWNEKRKDLPYDTDGLVIKVNDIALRTRMGATSKVPKWAKAYKFEAEQATTKLARVAFEIGKFGELTPVAEFEPPVQLAGTTVRRASMHNASWVEKKDVRLGDTVIVEKAGEIIPQVVGVVHESRTGKEKPIVWPAKCPVCGAEVVKDESASSFGYICSDLGRCPAQLTQRIIGFARRERMDIDGLGEEVAKLLVDGNLVKGVTDLYHLKKDQLLKLEKFGETKANNLLKGIQASKDRGLLRLMASLSIYGVGASLSEIVVDAYPDIDSLLAASVEDLAAIKGVGPKRAESIHSYFHSQLGEQVVKDLRAIGLKMTHEKKAAPAGGLPLAGMTIVVTGTLEKYDRHQIEAAIKDHGGKTSGSVSKKTSFVLAGEKAGSKLDKAQELGVKVLNEAEFNELIGVV